MCLTYSTQILHMFSTYSFIPTQIVSHVGPRGPVPGPKWQQAWPRPGFVAWSTQNVRGKYAEGGYPANSAQDSPHCQSHLRIPYTCHANSTHVPHIFHTYTSYIPYMFHAYSIHVQYIFHTYLTHILYYSIHIP